MKKLLLLTILLFAQSLFSQVSMQGKKLLKDGQTYKSSKYREVFSNPVAADYFKKGRANKTAAEIFSYFGGFGMGFSLGQIIASPKGSIIYTPYGNFNTKTDNSARWTVFAVSAGVTLVSLPFYLGMKKNFDKAIATENEGTSAFQPYFKVENSGNGVALSYNF